MKWLLKFFFYNWSKDYESQFSRLFDVSLCENLTGCINVQEAETISEFYIVPPCLRPKKVSTVLKHPIHFLILFESNKIDKNCVLILKTICTSSLEKLQPLKKGN